MRKRTRVALALAAAVILAIAGPYACSKVTTTSPATTTPDTVTLLIRVVDAYGAPLQGAKVASNSQPAGQSKATGLTGDQGTVTFSGMRPGDYEFVVSRYDFLQASRNVKAVAPGTEVTITMTAEAGRTSTTAAAEAVSFADLVARPEAFNERTVTVQGFWFDGFEIVVVAERLEAAPYSPGDVQPAGAKIWIKGGLPKEVSDRLTLQPDNPTGYPAHFGRVEVTGRFQYGSKYGHFDAYMYQMTITGGRILP